MLSKFVLFGKLCLLLCLALPLHSFAQSNCTIELHGVLRDEKTGEKLSFATIYIEELKTGAVSNDMGEFTISKLCKGNYTLRISHVACHVLRKSISLNESLNLNLTLDHSAHDIDNVNIIAKRENNTIGQRIERLEGRNLVSQQGDNLGNMLSKLNGVSALQTGSTISKPIIHGMHSNRVLILNNGIRQEGQQWGAEHAPEIDPFIAKKISLIKGANGVRYGSDAIAGVILVEPNDLTEKTGIQGEFLASGASNGRGGASSALIEGKLSKLGGIQFRLQGSVKKFGNVKTPNYYLKNTGVEEYNYSAALGYQFKKLSTEFYYSQFNTKLGIFSGSHIGNLSDLERAFNSSTPLDTANFSYTIQRPFQAINHELTKLKASYLFNNLNKLSLIFARQYNQRFEYDKDKARNDSIAALNLPEFQYRITTHSLDVDYEMHQHNGFSGNIGLNGMLQGNTYTGRYFIPNYKNQTLGSYYISKYTAGKFQAEAGLRADYRHLAVYKIENGVLINPNFNYFSPSLTLGSSYRFNEHIYVYANTGSAWRAPAPNELFSDGLHHGAATFELGNPNLKVERAWNSNLSVSYTHKNFTGELAFYLNRINNFINLVPSGETRLTIRGAFPEYIYVQQNALFKGIDWSNEISLNAKNKVKFQYAMVRATSRVTGENLPQIPADRSELGYTYLFADWEKLKKASLNISGTYYNKQWRVPTDFTVIRSNGESMLVRDFKTPPAAAFLVNIEFGCNLGKRENSAQLVFAIDNVFNTVYRNYLNRFRYFSDEQGRNFKLKIQIPLNF